MDNFGEQLAAARKAKGMSQKELAEQMYVTRTTVSHWEHGRHRPDVETLQRLGELLAFDPVEQEPAMQYVPIKRRCAKRLLMIAALVIILAACAMVGVLNHGKVDEAWFAKAELPRTGHAYLDLRPLAVQNADGWQVELIVEETSGINIALTELRVYVFDEETRQHTWKDGQLDDLMEQRALPGYQNMMFTFDVSGKQGTKVGILLKGVDETGSALSFHTLTELNE